MLTNRSAPPATVTPVLIYPDVRKAVAWLERAFGFGERVRIGEDHRAQLRVGADGSIVVADVHGDQVAYNGHLLYTFADDQAGQVTGQGVQGFFVATPGLAPIAGSSTSAGSSAPAGTVPAASSGSGYGY